MHVAPTRVAAVIWFQQLVAKMERQADKKLVTVITDDAPEFISGTFQQFFGGLGIEHMYSVPHELTHNGPVERIIRTLVSMTRQLLADGALPVRFWPHAARHAAFLYNRLAHGGLDSHLAPFTALYGALPRYHYLRPFGSLAFFKALPRPDKLSSRQAHLGVYLGSCLTSEAHSRLYWDPIGDRIVSSVSTRHLPKTNYADFDRYHTTSPSARLSAVNPLSHPVDPPVLFKCAVTDCPSCALKRAYLAVRAVQEPLDTTLYEHNPVCDKCETGGTLICCDFCNLIYHAHFIPGMRAQVHTAGFVCEDCHAQTFPDRQQEYAHLLVGRVLRPQYVSPPTAHRVANDAPVAAVTDARAAPSLSAATDLVADASVPSAPSSTLGHDAVAGGQLAGGSSAGGQPAGGRSVVARRAAGARGRPAPDRLRTSAVSTRRTRGSVGTRTRPAPSPSGVVASDYVPLLPRRRSSLYARPSTPRSLSPPLPARRRHSY
jgi:hypothetical protein